VFDDHTFAESIPFEDGTDWNAFGMWMMV